MRLLPLTSDAVDPNTSPPLPLEGIGGSMEPVTAEREQLEPRLPRRIARKVGRLSSGTGRGLLSLADASDTLPVVSKADYVENVRNLIVAHGGHDQAAFRRNVEAIIHGLSVGNRPGEAKTLRDALGTLSANGSKGGLTSLSKQAQGLVAFVSPLNAAQLFFSPETQGALDLVLDEYRAARKLAEGGLRPKTRLLFWGPPGCGKTAAAQWLATELAIPCGIVRLGSLITSFVGETGANLQRVLAMAEATPMVLLLDEADAVAKSRDDANDVGELRRVVNSLLQGLDGVAAQRSLIVFASNHSHLFDSAVWRRFDDVIEFPPPMPNERLAQLKHLTSGLKLRGSLLNTAKEMAGFSFSEIERAVSDATKTMILQGSNSVETADILREGKRWRLKMRAAAGSSGKRR